MLAYRVQQGLQEWGGSPLQALEAEGGLPPVLVQCIGKVKKCRGLPTVNIWLAGVEGSGPGDLRGAVDPCWPITESRP